MKNTRKFLLLEAVFWLGLAKLAIHALPFKKLYPFLGKPMCNSDISLSEIKQKNKVADVSSAIWTMSQYLPWQSKCLVRATAGKWMLRRRGFLSTLYLGAAMNDEKGLHAHAWLKCGDVFVSGSNGHEQFKILSYFGE